MAVLLNMLYMWFGTGYYYILKDDESRVRKAKAIFEQSFVFLILQMTFLL